MARTNRARDNDGAGSPIVAFFLRAGSKLLFGVVIVLAFLTIAQCTVKKPEAPTWSTQFVLPVVNRTYTMEELLQRIDEEGLAINDSGEVVFSITEDFDTVGLNDDDFATDDLSYTLSEQLGVIELIAPSISPVTVTFAQIGSLGAVLPGDSMFVPDTTFTVESALPPISSFTSATVAQGRIDVALTNHLDLTLDNIVLDLVDAQTSALIVKGTRQAPLASGAQAIIPLILDGKTVPSGMRLVATYHSPEDTVRSASTRYITSSFDFSDTLAVTSALARIPALTRVDTTAVNLAETEKIDSASLATGSLQITITNGSNLDAAVTVDIPDFVHNGQSLTFERQVPAQGSANISVNLAGYALVPQSDVVPQHLNIVATADIPGTGLSQVAVSQNDGFTVSAQVTDLTFHSVTGLFQSISASFDDISENLDVPTGFEDVELVNAILTLEIQNGIDLPGSMDIQITGSNGKQTAFISDIAPRGLATAVTTTVVNDDIADFLSPLPSRIDASGTVTFGDGSYQGTITRDDFVVGRLLLHAPLEMIINPSTVDMDIENEEIDQEDIDMVTDHFIEGRFVYQLTSHLPVGAYLNVYLGSDSTTLFTNPQLRFDSLYMTAAPIGPGGIVIDTAQTGEQEIHLDSLDIRILENPVLYIGQEILLEGSGGQVVKFTASDYIQVTGRIEIEYLFNGEF